jgi:hypothetical protein
VRVGVDPRLSFPMDEQQEELEALRRRVTELEAELADARSDIAVLTLEVESLDKLRRADIKRLAAFRSLD